MEISVGTVSRSIVANITGISTTKEAFWPAINFSEGTLNGLIVIAIPLTNTKLNRFAPIIFPRESDECPFTSEVIAVTNSGREVPKAMNVSAITDSGTPSPLAIICPLLTKRFL